MRFTNICRASESITPTGNTSSLFRLMRPIKKYSTQNDLDPYLVAALMSQESTFVAEIRSSANAYGLTQLTPATARQYARKLKIKYSQRLLTNPDANVRIGTMYFADTIRNLGSVPLALASYNAGPTPVRRWKSQKPDLPQDEFIDDIPYPETQNYVKKILSTTEDYWRFAQMVAYVLRTWRNLPRRRGADGSVGAAPAPRARMPA